MTQKMIKTNGIELHAKEYAKNGETVIFIHCSSGNTEQWRSVTPYFETDYHVVLLDMRGHGKSNQPDSDYTLNTMAKDIIGAMDALNIDKAHFVGSSMGAEIIVSLASANPDRVLSLCCEGAFQNFYGPNGEMNLPPEQIPADRQEKLDKIAAKPVEIYDSLETMLTHYKKVFADEWNESWNETWEALYLHKFRPTDDGKFILSFEPRYLIQYCEDFYQVDFGAYYKNITCPVLFLPDAREAADEGVMKSLEIFRGLLKKSSVVKIEKAEHAATMIQNPEGFSKAILGFIKVL